MFRKWHTCNYEWYRLYRSYENCRRPGVAILDMQMSKVPIISGYVAYMKKKSMFKKKGGWSCPQVPVHWTTFSHFWDRPVPIFSNVRFSNLALVQDKKITCVLPANACCTLCQLPPPPHTPQFSMLFLFKIINSLYISFQSFINTQVLTISHIIT